MKLHNLLGEMTVTVERINALRLALDERGSKLTAGDPIRQSLLTASAQVDELRKKIVATKEGGMITGEERLREDLSNLYGNVVNYEGRPSQTQVERADALARELADIVREFDAWTAKEMVGLNSALVKKKMEPIKTFSKDEWERKDAQK